MRWIAQADPHQAGPGAGAGNGDQGAPSRCERRRGVADLARELAAPVAIPVGERAEATAIGPHRENVGGSAGTEREGDRPTGGTEIRVERLGPLFQAAAEHLAMAAVRPDRADI